jgi:uncharacterized protein YjbI with pentapeptide repeats
MKTIKPQKLGVLTRCFEFGRRFNFGVSVLMFIPLSKDPALLSEVGMWKFAAAELGKDAALDAAVPKSKPEFIVTGNAYMPGGKPGPGCTVRARLGEREKLLHVFGDRYWNGPFKTDPEPFMSMPLDWAHAFGGEGYDKNPLGKGFKPVKKDKVEIKWLPNIQYPTRLDASPDQLTEPAGFGPVDFVWPQRFAKAGTYDDKWLKEDFPGYARNIDWTIFNLSSPDQWFDGPLKGDEPYLLENMHPSMPLIEGRLPGFIARCFINRRKGEGESFEEITTRLTTVWFFPGAERAVLIYQGFCEVAEEDAADILQIVVGAELAGEPKSAGHYMDVFSRRMDKEKGFLYSLRDSDLIPAGLSADEKDKDAELSDGGDDLLRKSLRKRAVVEIEKARAVVAGYGLDPDKHAPPLPKPDEPVPDIEQLPEYMNKMLAEAEARKITEQEAAGKSLQEAEKLFATLGMDFNVVRKEIAERPTGPPAFSAQAQINSMKELAQDLRNKGIVVDELDGYINDPVFCNRLIEGERKLKEVYRFTANHQDAPPPMQEEQAKHVRSSVAEAVSKGESLAGRDLTGADLSGLDLHGVNFEGAFLESVNLDSSILKGANFNNAVLAHASLKGADLTGAKLSGANLGAADLTGAQAGGVDFSDAIISKANLTGADFKGAQLHGADCSGSVFKDTDFSGVLATELIFLESNLQGIKLAGAQMEKCVFIKVDVTGVDFSGANLTSAVFLEVKGKGARFNNADMTNVRFVEKSAFESADFTGACLVKANLRGSLLSGCNFTLARLDGADLSECDLRNAVFHQAVARGALFVKANLNGAALTSINAMNAIFQRSDIRGADFRGANLFQADIARVHTDPRTQLTETFTKKIRIYPRRQTEHGPE